MRQLDGEEEEERASGEKVPSLMEGPGKPLATERRRLLLISICFKSVRLRAYKHVWNLVGFHRGFEPDSEQGLKGVIHIEVSAKERVLLLHAFANSVILCVRMSSSLKRVDLGTMKWCLYYG